MGAGLVGALAYTFSDSFWFSAVEGEVYGVIIFTAIVFWAALKWFEEYDQEGMVQTVGSINCLFSWAFNWSSRNLLAIPAIVYMYYFKE